MVNSQYWILMPFVCACTEGQNLKKNRVLLVWQIDKAKYLRKFFLFDMGVYVSKIFYVVSKLTVGWEQQGNVFVILKCVSMMKLFRLLRYDLRVRNKIIKLDLDPRKDDYASPMSSYKCMLRLTWMLVSALPYKSKFNFDFFFFF